MSGTPTLGMGFCPLGFSLFGYGVPATAGVDAGFTLQQSPNGASGDARKIDVDTRDYIIDEDGMVKGQSAIAQQVFLAVITTKGSSVVQQLGSELLSIKTFDKNTFNSRVTNVIQQALSELIKNGSISLISVDAGINPNGVAGNIVINWVDNSTKEINQTRI